MLSKYVDDTLPFRNDISTAAACQGHFECILRAGQRNWIGYKVFKVNRLGGPSGSCRGFDLIHEKSWAAQIKMRSLWPVG